MAESIKFDDKYIDTTGVYDSTLGKTMRELLTYKAGVPTPAEGAMTEGTENYSTWHQLGPIVLLNVGISLTQTSGSAATIFTGLPKARAVANGTLTNGADAQSIRVYTDGTVHFESWQFITGYATGQLVYFTDEI